MTVKINIPSEMRARLENNHITALHIEDNQADTHLVVEEFINHSQLNFSIDSAATLSIAKEKLNTIYYDIVFLDLPLQNPDGLSSIETIRKVNDSIPIIVLTGSYDEKVINEIVDYGAQDYIHKDEFSIKVFDRTIRYAIERKKTEKALELLAHRDGLTKLANRFIFMDRLQHALLTRSRNQHPNHIVVMLLDLDNFKQVNDTMGHAVGDALLIQVANRLQNCVREIDTVARLGGDEFTILLEEVEQLNTVGEIANKILSKLSEPFIIDNRHVFTSPSIGVSSTYDQKNANAESILKNSDIAMYSAKKKGGNQIAFFTRELQVTAQIRSNLEKNLKIAIEQEQLTLHFQPQVDLRSGQLCGAEALIRWNHPQHGLISPDGFIPALEETGLIIPATEWVINKALNTWKYWLEKKKVSPNMTVSINIPPQFIRHYKMHQQIEDISQLYNIDNQQIELELTENAFIDITPKNLEVLNKLKEHGFRLAIDDFGTGYSSLGYLKAFPIDKIKLDKTFIKDIVNSPKDAAIAQAMIQLCQKLDINLIAEGVDNKEKLELLKSFGCHVIQGFYFSKPLSMDDFPNYVEQFKA